MRARWLVITALVMGGTAACNEPSDAPGVWTEMPVDDPSWSLHVDEITATSATDAWATGYSSFHWDGKIWTDTLPKTDSTEVEHLRKISENDIWTFGEGGAAHWDGRKAVDYPLRRSKTVSASAHSVAVAGPKDIWVAGSGFFTHWDGRSWTDQPERPSVVTMSPAGTPTAMWNEPFGIRHWNGHQWISDPLPPIEVPKEAHLVLNDLKGDLAVGNIESSTSTVRPLDTVVLRFDGTRWQRITHPRQDFELYAVAPDGKGGMWVGTGDPYVLHYDGRTWTKDRLDLPGDDSKWNISDLALIPGTQEVWLTAFNQTDSDATDRILRLDLPTPSG